MFDINNLKIKSIQVKFHDAVCDRTITQRQLNEEITTENKLFLILCEDHSCTPDAAACKMKSQFDIELSSVDVIQMLRKQIMANPNERKQLFDWAEAVTDLFEKAIQGDRTAYDQFQKKRKEAAVNKSRKHKAQERIVMLMLYQKHPELDMHEDIRIVCLMGNTLAKYLFYDMCDAVGIVYGFPIYKEKKTQEKQAGHLKTITNEEAVAYISQLEVRLERSNAMLQELQNEFDEQLADSKVKELTDFFVRLNSEQYGCILDELIQIRKGVDRLRKEKSELPMEINGLLILVKQLIHFVRDSHIEPILKIGAVQEVTAADIQYYSYEGSPFTSPEERKSVKVILPGWIFMDKQVQISRPRVKEKK